MCSAPRILYLRPLKRPLIFSMPVPAPCLGFSVILAGSLAQAGAVLVGLADLIRPEPSSHAPVSVSPLVDTAWQVRHPIPRAVSPPQERGPSIRVRGATRV